MGDRASIAFKNGDEVSVVLFSHWGGMGFVKQAIAYAVRLKDSRKSNTYPLHRCEPATVMVDFIRYLTKDKELVNSDLYLGKDEYEGDNSDNGHHIIDFEKLKNGID